MQVGAALPPAEHVPPLFAGPAVQAVFAVLPAVQALVAVDPAVQSIAPPESPPPAEHPPPLPPPLPPTALPLEQAAGTTELPVVQTPDPLAIDPNGTATGDSYFSFCMPRRSFR